MNVTRHEEIVPFAHFVREEDKKKTFNIDWHVSSFEVVTLWGLSASHFVMK